MSVSPKDFENLKQNLGEDWANRVVSAVEAQGKAVRNAGVTHKNISPVSSLIKMDGMDDEDEDEKGDNPFAGDDEEDEEKTFDGFTDVDMVFLAGLKDLTSGLVANHKELDAQRKQVKDLANQVDINNKSIGTVTDSLRRIEKYLGQLTKRMPASKSDSTLYNGGDELVDKAVDKNHEDKNAPEPLLSQMRKSYPSPTPTPSE